MNNTKTIRLRKVLLITISVALILFFGFKIVNKIKLDSRNKEIEEYSKKVEEVMQSLMIDAINIDNESIIEYSVDSDCNIFTNDDNSCDYSINKMYKKGLIKKLDIDNCDMEKSIINVSKEDANYHYYVHLSCNK